MAQVLAAFAGYDFQLAKFAQSIAETNRPFQFQKRRQLFIRVHNETLSVAMRVHNPDRSPFAIQGRDVAPTPTCSAEIVSDDFPIPHPVPGHRSHGYAGGF